MFGWIVVIVEAVFFGSVGLSDFYYPARSATWYIPDLVYVVGFLGFSSPWLTV